MLPPESPQHGNSRTKMCVSAPTFLFPSDDRVTWTQRPGTYQQAEPLPKEKSLGPRELAPRNRGSRGAGGASSGSWGPPTHTVRDKSLRGKRAVPSVLHSADSSTLGSELRKMSQDSRTRGRSGHRMRAKTRTRGGQSLGWPCFVPLRPDGEVWAP